MTEEQKYWAFKKKMAKENAEADKVNSKLERLGAYGGIASQAGQLFGDTSELASESDFTLGQTLQSSGLGLSTFAALGGPVGAGIGAALGVASFILGKKKREKAKREAEARWNKGLEKYKKQVKALKKNTELKESEINKALGQGVQFSLLETARRDAEQARQLTEAQRGVKATTYQKQVKGEAETASAEVEIFDDRLLEKLNILDEAQALAEKELTARRDVFGSYKTDYADQLEQKLTEFDEV